jgi:uncharacterized protein YydD (DUF2326 family)
MIHRIFSSLPTFKGIDFRPGLNVLLAKKEPGASERQTRNRAGKTSLIEIVHFLTGADAGKESLFRTEALADALFGIEFDHWEERVIAERSGRHRSRIHVTHGDLPNNTEVLSNSEWVDLLGDKMFGLGAISTVDGRPRPSLAVCLLSSANSVVLLPHPRNKQLCNRLVTSRSRFYSYSVWIGRSPVIGNK